LEVFVSTEVQFRRSDRCIQPSSIAANVFLWLLLLLIAVLFGQGRASAQSGNPCAKELGVLSDYQSQLQTARNALGTQACDGPGQLLCTRQIAFIGQEISAAQSYIKKGCPAGTPVPPGPFDLVWTQNDDQGLPLSPIWYFQKTNDGQAPDPKMCLNLPGKFANTSCSTQNPLEDTGSGWNGTWCNVGASTSIDGHVNWMPVTYNGWATWSDHSADDDDYNFVFTSPTGEADVPSNVSEPPSASDPRGLSSLLLEFDSDETIDHFRTPWWSKFHSAVDNGDQNNLILSPQAVVTGLLGLDCEHGCGTEIHPVYSFAMDVDANPSNDVWAMFLRNWGDEGYCSSFDHPVDQLTSMAIRIPWWPGATGVKVLNAPDDSDKLFLTNVSGVTGPDVTWAVGQGVLVRFGLPFPSVHPRINGELHLQWIFTPGAGLSTAKVPKSLQSALVPDRGELDDTEAKVNALFAKLPVEQKTAIKAKLAGTGQGDGLPLRSTHAPQQMPTLVNVPKIAPVLRNAPDSEKQANDTAKKVALCTFYKNNVPGNSNYCK
jgi:hypothetical protein